MGNEVNTSEVKLENGTLNALGIDIKISDILGEKIVNQWMAQISEEDMQLIFDTLEKEVFSHNYNDEKYFVTKMTSKDHWGNIQEVSTPIYKYAQNLYAQKFNERILAKVDEIIDSDEFEKRADQIAADIVDYATEGYKQDMITRIRERMIDNVITSTVYCDGQSLKEIIHQEIMNVLHR